MDNAFRNGMRVIVNGDGPPELIGKSGTVIRVTMRSWGEAWVNMDEAPPEAIAAFTGDDEPRRNWVMLNIGQVEAASEASVN